MKYMCTLVIFQICFSMIYNLLCFDHGRGYGVYAQDYPYRRYQDRKEGITKKMSLKHGNSKIELISALIENPDSISSDDLSKIHLSFYLSEDSRAKIIVEEFEESYRLELLQKEFNSGLFNFSWPAEIVQYYNISLEDFAPFAQVLPKGHKKIIPIVIYTKLPGEFSIRYRFSIVPYRPVRILEYRIYKSDSSELIYFEELRDLTAERPVNISWNGLNQENVEIQSGQYDFVIETIFENLPGQEPDTVNTKYHFYHYSELLQEISGFVDNP